MFEASYGMANLELRSPVNPRTSFEIASMTKQFTDAAVLLLAERGRLALTDHLTKYLPDLPPSWQAITLQQLMNHTSGLRDDWDEENPFFSTRTTNQEFLEALKAAPLKFAPGTGWSYSCGPFLLGLVIERVTGMSYAQFMRGSILVPLALRSTGVNDPVALLAGRASGYRIRGGVIGNGVRISAAAESRADVGLYSTARDLARWDAALDDASLLTTHSRALMFAPARLDDGAPTPYGLGWFITPFRGHTEIAHGGGFRTGFSTVIARYPDDRLTVILLTNLQGAHAYSIARGVASFFNEDYRPIPSMRTGSDGDSSRTRTAARILTALRDSASSAELLPVARRLSITSEAELRSELVHATAPLFIGCQDLQRRTVKVADVPIVANCFYRTDGDAPRYWTMSFTSDGRVAYLELEE